MKPFEKRTSKFVNSYLRNLRDNLNLQLRNLSEEEVIIPTTEALTTENILFAIELATPHSLGDRKFASRH